MSQPPPIPFHRHSIGEEEIAEVVATLRSGWLTSGPRTERFEEEFREYASARHALAVSSGTAAMHLALASLGIGPGDEVITTPLTFASTVHVIVQCGATPVLADVGEDGNIDPGSIAGRITARTRALLPVHLGGLPCDMERLWRVAAEHGLYVVEDAAHAAGTHTAAGPVGASNANPQLQSDAAAFSFYVTKNLATGEGGMLATPHDNLAGKLKLLRLHGIDRDIWRRGSWRYAVTEGGFKYNLSDIQSAIGIHQLRKLEGFIEVRARYAQLYRELLAGTGQMDLPESPPWGRHGWHLFPIRLRTECLAIGRDEFIRQLGEAGIGASVHFIPIPLHPYFEFLAKDPRNACPRARALFPRLVSLPLYPAMPEDDVARVAAAVKSILWSHRVRRAFAVGA